jgi:hypothetical protein
MQGWDWIQAMPDRSTGFFGPETLDTMVPLAIVDPAIQTLDFQCDWDHHSNAEEKCRAVKLRLLVSMEGIGQT